MPPELPTTDADERLRVHLDPLIAPLVRLLNDRGYSTFSSCEGHGDGIPGHHPHVSLDPVAGRKLKELLAWLAASNERTSLLWQIVPFFAYEMVGDSDVPDYCLLTPADTNEKENLELAHGDFAILIKTFEERFPAE